ncbi:MAG: ATP-binding protein [Anaerolineae bacterium]
MFVNRETELAFLEGRYRSSQAELVVLYGRRRVGKTDLLHQFCQDKPHVFFVADLGTAETNLVQFSRAVSQHVHGDPEVEGVYRDWDQGLARLARLAQDERFVAVFDEFTYLVSTQLGITSTLQRVWDETLRRTQIMLILCGSYVGMMMQHVLDYRAPLYGRRTGDWYLQPFAFQEATSLLAWLPREDQLRAYAVLGGMPAYLVALNPHWGLLENIEHRVLQRGTFLHNEPRLLLQSELRDPTNYFSVLEAIASGATRPSEIAQRAGLPLSALTYYLNNLRDLGLVERAVPATEPRPERSRRAFYHLADGFFRFWFRYVLPNRSLLERGQTEPVVRKVATELDTYTGPVFEDVCREQVWRLSETGQLPFTVRRVGGWWSRTAEVDLCAVGDEDILLGECKWWAGPVGLNVLDGLRARAGEVARATGHLRPHLSLFARNGFTPEVEAVARTEGVLLFDFRRWPWV